MKKIFFWSWLIIEFYLLAYATLSLTGELVSRLPISSSAGAWLRAISCLIVPFIGLLMNFHPYYKLEFRLSAKTDKGKVN